MSVIKNFMWDAMKTIVEDEISATENDAVGFRTTGNPLLDLNFSTASLRRWSQDEIVRLFAQAFQEDWKLAMCWLFFCRDCRGGMGNSEVMALEVANALGLYFAERLTGPFKDRFITFSSRPQLVDVSKAKTLHDRLEICYAHDECSNTNIEATFDLILEMAVRHGLKEDELPSNVLVLSDMEFDCACGYVGGYCRMDRYGADRNALFTVIRRNFEVRGYKLPRLVFWNLNSRTRTIPVKKNKLGASLVSGFSPAIAKMVLSGKLDPFECLKEQLDGPRYDAVGKALEECAA